LRDEIGPLVDDMNLIDIWEAYLARPKKKANEPRIHEHSKQEKAYFEALHKEIPDTTSKSRIQAEKKRLRGFLGDEVDDQKIWPRMRIYESWKSAPRGRSAPRPRGKEGESQDRGRPKTRSGSQAAASPSASASVTQAPRRSSQSASPASQIPPKSVSEHNIDTRLLPQSGIMAAGSEARRASRPPGLKTPSRANTGLELPRTSQLITHTTLPIAGTPAQPSAQARGDPRNRLVRKLLLHHPRRRRRPKRRQKSSRHMSINQRILFLHSRLYILPRVLPHILPPNLPLSLRQRLRQRLRLRLLLRLRLSPVKSTISPALLVITVLLQLQLR
jgi:hypothetical protein